MTDQNHYSSLSKKMNIAYTVNENSMGNNEIILHEQESLPEIYSIKKIYLIIAMGRIVMQLDDQGEKIYSPGSVIDVPSRTKMKIMNLSSDKTAILVMKL